MNTIKFAVGDLVVAHDYDGNESRGKVERIGCGIWGYGGDSVAVYVDGKAYPSEKVRLFNVETGVTK